MITFQGYYRPDGTVGVRNHIAVIPSVGCANVAAERIAMAVPGTVAVLHNSGCDVPDPKPVIDTLVGTGRNPNVAAVLVIGLGCELIQATEVAARIAESGKPTEVLVIQTIGSVPLTVTRGIEIVSRMAKETSRQLRQSAPLSKLILATECGGSDATSGLVANPVLGIVSDSIIREGGAVILSETTELIGAEHLLASRAATKEVRQRMLDMILDLERKAALQHLNIRSSQPSPGNIAGGLTTIEEKSLGCISKAGTSPVQGVLKYAEPVPGPGLYIMDTPGQDIYSVAAMIAGGAQIVAFTTGLGTPVGSPIAPVIKITGNPHTAQRMADHIDFSAGLLIEGKSSASELAQQLFELVLEVANGRLTASEALGHREFGIYEGGILIT